MAARVHTFLTVTLLLLRDKGDAQQQYFRVKPKDTEIVEGQTADLQCHIGSQAGQVQWSKDGFVLGFDPDIPGYPRYSMIVDKKRSVYNLRVKEAQLDDEGTYQCQVGPGPKNHPIRTEARVTVLVPPKEVSIQRHANGSVIEVREAERISLTCIAKNSKPAAKLKWYKNGLQLYGGSSHSKEENKRDRLHSVSSTITVYVIMDDNGATYSCDAVHRALSQNLRTSVTISVLYPPGVPEIEGYQEGDIVQVGDTLTLACITRGGNPPAELIWYRDNVQIDMSFSTSGKEVTNIHTFTVDVMDNNAVFRCEASNSVTYHPRIASVKLSVLFAPSKITITGPKEGKLGMTVNFSCSAGPSNPPADITWVVDGRPFIVLSDVQLTKSGWMTTSNISVTLTRQDPDTKTFSCYAVSEALSESIIQTVSFKVVYPPNPPSIIGYEEGKPIRSGEFQKFTCMAIGGNPLATLRWYKRDREVRATSSVSGNGVFSELVVRADATDNGAIYRCEAFNSATEKPLQSTVTLTVYFPPSSVSIRITPNRPRSGEQVTINCESGSSNPQSSIHWWKNGDVITDQVIDVVDAIYGGKSTYSKIELNVTSGDDKSVFTCQATNQVLQRSVHDSVTLRVLYKPTFLIDMYEKFDVVESESVLINLTALGNPSTINYSWKKGLVPLPDDTEGFHWKADNSVTKRVSSKGPLLEIAQAKREDTGQYECRATNTEGFAQIAIIINVLYPASVTTVTRSTVVSQGADAFLECGAIGNPMSADVIKWRRKGFNMSRTEEMIEWGKSYLTVVNVSREDAGMFECVAYNGIGEESVGKSQLIVKFKPHVYLPKRFRKVAAGVGETVRLLCLANGAPLVSFVWTCNGSVIKENLTNLKYSVQSAQIENTTWESILVIKGVQETDFGDYLCVGKNEMGHGDLRINLRKRGKPDPPEDIKVQNTTSSCVFLTWSPGFNGGLPQHFRIRYKKLGGQDYTAVDVLPYNSTTYCVDGLLPSTEYEFVVIAVNTLGESEPHTQAVTAFTLSGKELSSTSLDALSHKNGEMSNFLMVTFTFIGLFLLLVNVALVACYLRWKRRRQVLAENTLGDVKTNPFASSMYSRDKYHETINGEALRSPLAENEDGFHEELLMKELMSTNEKKSKATAKCPSSKSKPGVRRKSGNSSQNNCPDILRNGHTYVKEECLKPFLPGSSSSPVSSSDQQAGASTDLDGALSSGDCEDERQIGVNPDHPSNSQTKVLVVNKFSEDSSPLNSLVYPTEGHLL